MPSYQSNPLDQEVNTELMRVCKCVIPYLDRGVQKNVAIGLKFLELVNTINAYGDPLNSNNSISLTRQGHWQEDLLRSVRSNLSPDKAYLIDAVIKLQEFKSILNTKDTGSSIPTTLSSYEPEPSFEQAPQFEPFSDLSREVPKNEKVPPKSQTSSGPSPANILQMLSPLLDDNQKQLFNAFASLMGNMNTPSS